MNRQVRHFAEARRRPASEKRFSEGSTITGNAMPYFIGRHGNPLVWPDGILKHRKHVYLVISSLRSGLSGVERVGLCFSHVDLVRPDTGRSM